MFDKIINIIGLGTFKAILVCLMVVTLPVLMAFSDAGFFMNIIDIGILFVLYSIT